MIVYVWRLHEVYIGFPFPSHPVRYVDDAYKRRLRDCPSTADVAELSEMGLA